eukprot:Nitzschia sp. Nitz4//scaffold27_size158506//76952//80746//NITZ4_002602-RA/size158506-processed-gene-0.266-mRNA-1//-1//CDS//3329545494//9246//frame0
MKIAIVPAFQIMYFSFLILAKRPTRAFSPATLLLGARRCRDLNAPVGSCSFSSLRVSESTDSMDGRDSDQLLLSLQHQITKLNGGTPINVQSPKQVSEAIFGRRQSSNRTILQQAVQDKDLSPNQRQLAQLVLHCRELSSAVNVRQNSVEMSEQTEGEGVTKSVEPTDSQPSQRSPQFSNRHRYEQSVDFLFDSPGSMLDPYWRDPLRNVTRPVARELLKQMDGQHCPMGFDPNATPKGNGVGKKTLVSTAGKKGTFLAFCREQKQIYPQSIILTRMGDFYETYGMDALLLVEHAGLNPMGGKARAGCPWRNVQATLNCLTEQGFSVAVYEEVGQTSSTSKLKTRVLSQIVSPANPAYLYDNWLLGGDQEHASLDQLPPSRPCVGIVKTAAGYHLIEVSLEEQSVEFSERLTPEAVACRLAAYPPAEPLVYVPSAADTSPPSRSLSFLPQLGRLDVEPRHGSSQRQCVETNLGGFRIRTLILSPDLIPNSANLAGSESDRYIQAVVDTLIQWNAKRHETDGDTFSDSSSEDASTYKDFTVSKSSTHTNPLYMETATQLGLLKDPTIPSLISHVLDDAAPAPTRRFIQRYLLVPPPPEVSQALATVVRTLMDPDSSVALPPLLVPPLGKVLSLIRAGQASANIYGELLQMLDVTMYVLKQANWNSDATEALLTLCSHESGLVADRESLLERCLEAERAIESIVSHVHHVDVDGSVAPDESSTKCVYIPDGFLERNEEAWRGRIQRSVAEEAYRRVEIAATALEKAVADDYILGDESNKALLKQDIFNNMFALQKVPNGGKAENYIHPRDRHGKTLSSRYTTKRVKDALSEYVSACEDACSVVSAELSNLAKVLQDEGHMPALIQSAHFNLALSAAFHHSVKASKQNWHLAEVVEGESAAPPRFVGLWPYWMPQSQGVNNTFDLEAMFLLTAPNMSGKSTLMRSTAAAALLTICGLCAPLQEGSRVPRFDTIFLRGASADVPAENKSAFGAEMEDMAALMRCCSSKSLVFVDEIGRGTSPRDGTRLAAAILEAMVNRGMRGIFATHLHDILKLPLTTDNPVITKQMAISQEPDPSIPDSKSIRWTYKLDDGVCNDSLAMMTASRFGLPLEIIQRANELESYLPNQTYFEANFVSRNEETNMKAAEKVDANSKFQEAVALASELVGQSPNTIPARCSPPPALANKSCVYILGLQSNPPRFYVGETDDLFQRLRTHRSKGGAWAKSQGVAFAVPSKSDARHFESLLIQRLAQSGFYMESVTDGRSKRL